MRRVLAVAVGAVLLLSLTGSAHAGNQNGRCCVMPAFYDDELFNINFKLLKPDLHKNPSFNIIYQCDQCEEQGFTFVSVLDAIQGDGFNPIWEEVQITFNDGNQFQQFTSDTEVLNAAKQGIITLTDTEEFYRCSVVGPK